MSIYEDYLKEIEERKLSGLKPKPIDGAELTSEIISQIKDTNHQHRKDSLHYFIYNTLPGTTSAASEKALSQRINTWRKCYCRNYSYFCF